MFCVKDPFSNFHSNTRARGVVFLEKNLENINLTPEKNEMLGELDSLNSFIGLAKSFAKLRQMKNVLTQIQHDLFFIQRYIANTQGIFLEEISLDRILEIQRETASVEKRLVKINHFILPEGCALACALHCARTWARSVERKILGYLESPTNTSSYLDQLACLLFALARQANQQCGIVEQKPNYLSEKPSTKRGKP